MIFQHLIARVLHASIAGTMAASLGLSATAALQPQAGHPAAAHKTATHRVLTRPAPLHHAAVRHKAPAAPKPPSVIYDSAQASAITGRSEVAVYATGGYVAQPSQVRGDKLVLWIDVTGRDYSANVLDVEPGDATPAMSGSWVYHREHGHLNRLARVYTMLSDWSAVRASVARLPASIQARVRWWIADPTGHRHIVPGSAATQWQWGKNCDVSAVTPRFTR